MKGLLQRTRGEGAWTGGGSTLGSLADDVPLAVWDRRGDLVTSFCTANSG